MSKLGLHFCVQKKKHVQLRKSFLCTPRHHECLNTFGTNVYPCFYRDSPLIIRSRVPNLSRKEEKLSALLAPFFFYFDYWLRSVTGGLGCLATLTLIEIRISTTSHRDSSVQLKIYTAVQRLLKQRHVYTASARGTCSKRYLTCVILVAINTKAPLNLLI